ncbi:MAG: Fe(2+)-trafficking protein [Nitrospirales bacterium]
MPTVKCVRCGKDGETIAEPIFMGKLEAEIKSKVCKDCWFEWNGPGKAKTMMINEYQINLGDESGREFLKKQMRAFLKIGEAVDTSKLQENYRPERT